MWKMNDIFCRIINKEVQVDIVYEDENVISFLDINPYVKGHLLVVPKKHSKWIWDMNEKDYKILMERTKYLADVLRQAFDTDWIEMVVAGIGIEHVHIHLLPRKKDDGLGELPKKPLEPKLSGEEMEEIAEKIRENL